MTEVVKVVLLRRKRLGKQSQRLSTDAYSLNNRVKSSIINKNLEYRRNSRFGGKEKKLSSR